MEDLQLRMSRWACNSRCTVYNSSAFFLEGHPLSVFFFFFWICFYFFLLRSS